MELLSDGNITIGRVCHESFHVAMSVCQFCNMSLGFKVGEDEHAAYIAGLPVIVSVNSRMGILTGRQIDMVYIRILASTNL